MRNILAATFAAALWLALASVAPAHAQNVTCPTMPPGDNSNACASTAFVQAAAGGVAILPQNQIYVGNASGFATAVAMSGDCTIVASGAVTCTKVNGTTPGNILALNIGTGLGSGGGNLNLQPAAAATIGGVQSKTCAASNWISTISTAGVETCSQPAFSDISGQATLAQLPTIATSTVLGNFTGGSTVPAAASVPSCAQDTLHALTNDSAGGFNCTQVIPTAGAAGDIIYWNGSAWVKLAGNSGSTQVLQENSSGVPSWATIAGSGTVTSVATGYGLSGGTITTSGTLTAPLIAVAAQANLGGV